MPRDAYRHHLPARLSAAAKSGARTFRLFLAFVILPVIAAAHSPHAKAACPDTVSEAVNAAREVLSRPQEASMTDRDRHALLCVLDAVAAIDARVQGLNDGSIPFDGQINAPKGILFAKPPASEVD